MFFVPDFKWCLCTVKGDLLLYGSDIEVLYIIKKKIVIFDAVARSFHFEVLLRRNMYIHYTYNDVYI